MYGAFLIVQKVFLFIPDATKLMHRFIYNANGSFPFGGMRSLLIKKITIIRYFYAETQYNKFKSHSTSKVIFFLFNTEETQTLIFHLLRVI